MYIHQAHFIRIYLQYYKYNLWFARRSLARDARNGPRVALLFARSRDRAKQSELSAELCEATFDWRITERVGMGGWN